MTDVCSTNALDIGIDLNLGNKTKMIYNDVEKKNTFNALISKYNGATRPPGFGDGDHR